MNRKHVALMMMSLLLCQGASAVDMPPEVHNVSLGMTLKDLVASRPNLKWITIDGEKKIDPEKQSVGRYMFSETLPSGGDFQGATYGISDGKVVSIGLASDPALGHKNDARKRLVKECIDRWGKAYKKRAPEDARRPGNPRPMLTWEKDGVEIVLMLPQNRKKGDTKPNGPSIHIRSMANAKPSSWKEMKISDSEKKALFESHDVIEK